MEPVVEDEFSICGALCNEIADMGMEVVGMPLVEPTDADLVVKFQYDGGWEFTRYLKAFEFRFINAKSGKSVLICNYRSVSIANGVSEGRLNSAFDDIRKKCGYPRKRGATGTQDDEADDL